MSEARRSGKGAISGMRRQRSSHMRSEVWEKKASSQCKRSILHGSAVDRIEDGKWLAYEQDRNGQRESEHLVSVPACRARLAVEREAYI